MLKNLTATQSVPSSRLAPQAPVSRSVSVAPGSIKSVALGIFGASAATPTFSTTFSPAAIGEKVKASLERLDMPGDTKYMLMYQFHNLGPKECVVTVNREQ
jgi:hypothetical protein